MCTRQNLAGPGPGFDSKSEQLTSIPIQTDPRQRTSGPVPHPLRGQDTSNCVCALATFLFKKEIACYMVDLLSRLLKVIDLCTG